jgi:hypothetical protein
MKWHPEARLFRGIGRLLRFPARRRKCPQKDLGSDRPGNAHCNRAAISGTAILGAAKRAGDMRCCRLQHPLPVRGNPITDNLPEQVRRRYEHARTVPRMEARRVATYQRHMWQWLMAGGMTGGGPGTSSSSVTISSSCCAGVGVLSMRH